MNDYEIVDVADAGIDNEYPHGKPALLDDECNCLICGGPVEGMDITFDFDLVPEENTWPTDEEAHEARLREFGLR